MARRKKNRAASARYFVITNVVAESGYALDEHGHPADPVIRLELIGRWSHGQDQRIPALIRADLTAGLVELLERQIAASPPPADVEEPETEPTGA